MNIELYSLRMKNFRGFVDETIYFDNDLSVIIGRNDIGKSTIFEALDFFFNEKIKMTREDHNILQPEEEPIEISCCFTIKDEATIIIDSTVATSLKSEYLLNSEGKLEILKIYDCMKKSIAPKIYLRANYPVINETPLVCEKIKDLREKLKKCVSKAEYDSVNKNIAADIRCAIYEAQIDLNTVFEETNIDMAQEDAKNIWNSLQKDLPLYFLFKADRTNTDKDAEVQSPLKAITKTVTAELQSEFDEIINAVKEKVEIIGQETIKKLSELDHEIACDLHPDISTKPLDSIFSFDLISDNGIALNKRGSGVRRLILLSYFRVEAERAVENNHNNSIIYAIEEPETAQHPNYQRMIIETLQELSQDGKHQIFITTHTPEIAKLVDLSQLIFLRKGPDGVPVVESNDDTKYRMIVDELGILPYAIENCVICVEGKNDENFLKNINKNIEEYKKIIDFETQKIKIIPLIGSNLTTWVNENYFKESNIKEIHIYDNDRNDYREKIEEITRECDGRRFAFQIKRREIENYIPPKLIEQEFDVDLSKYYDTWDRIDVPKVLCTTQILSNIEKESERKKEIKKMLNGRIAKKITADLLKEIEAYDELKELFKLIQRVSS